MRRRVSAATGPVLLSTRETVAIDTPALRATSLIEALTAVRRRRQSGRLCTAAPGRMSSALCKRLQSGTVTAPSAGLSRKGRSGKRRLRARGRLRGVRSDSLVLGLTQGRGRRASVRRRPVGCAARSVQVCMGAKANGARSDPTRVLASAAPPSPNEWRGPEGEAAERRRSGGHEALGNPSAYPFGRSR